MQEWIESRSRELQTKKKRKVTVKGQAASVGNGPDVLEVTEREKGG